eukprot:12190784-Alexandrium_andersonii.AAC.1
MLDMRKGKRVLRQGILPSLDCLRWQGLQVNRHAFAHAADNHCKPIRLPAETTCNPNDLSLIHI